MFSWIVQIEKAEVPLLPRGHGSLNGFVTIDQKRAKSGNETDEDLSEKIVLSPRWPSTSYSNKSVSTTSAIDTVQKEATVTAHYQQKEISR